MTIRSGKHLGKVRSWIQRRFRNGDTVTWGSNEVLVGSALVVRELEYLSEDIRVAANEDLVQTLRAEIKTRKSILNQEMSSEEILDFLTQQV